MLLSGAAGVRPAKIVILGAGIAGTSACQVAVGVGAHVCIVDINPAKLRYVHDILGGHVTTLMSNRANLEEVERSVGPQAWRQHRFIEASIVEPAACREACRGVDIVLHQAALGSVPRSIADPVPTHQTNVTGFVNMLVAARDASVQRFVYASSSSTCKSISRRTLATCSHCGLSPT